MIKELSENKFIFEKEHVKLVAKKETSSTDIELLILLIFLTDKAILLLRQILMLY